MNYNILNKIEYQLYDKYRNIYNKHEIKITIIISVFVCYMVKNREMYNLQLNSMLDLDILQALFISSNTNVIENEIILKIEEQLLTNHSISNIYRNIEVKKDKKFMTDMIDCIFQYISDYDISPQDVEIYINHSNNMIENRQYSLLNYIIEKFVYIEPGVSVLNNYAGNGELIRDLTDKNKENIEIEIQEISKEQCALASIMMIISKYKNFQVNEVDCLKYKNERQYDFILSTAPLIMDTTSSLNYELGKPSKRDSWGGIATSLASLKENGTLIAIINTGALSSGKKADINARKILCEKGLIKQIIELPERMLYGININVAIVIIQKKENEDIELINLSNVFPKSETYTPKKIDEILNSQNIYRKINKKELLEDNKLLPSLYDVSKNDYKIKYLNELKKEGIELNKNLVDLNQQYSDIFQKLEKEEKYGQN